MNSNNGKNTNSLTDEEIQKKLQNACNEALKNLLILFENIDVVFTTKTIKKNESNEKEKQL